MPALNGTRAALLHISLSHCAHKRLNCKQRTSIAYISTATTLIDKALADLASSESPNISVTARAYVIHPSTLNRRWNGTSISKGEALCRRRFRKNQQQRSLIGYSNELSRRSAAPTPAMMTAFASQLAGRASGHCWVSRFASRHRSELDSACLNKRDLKKHQAHSVYFPYFPTNSIKAPSTSFGWLKFKKCCPPATTFSFASRLFRNI